MARELSPQEAALAARDLRKRERARARADKAPRRKRRNWRDLHFSHPRGKKRPQVIEKTANIVSKQIEERDGRFWDYLSKHAPVYAHGGGTAKKRRPQEQKPRQRKLKSEAARPFAVVLNTIIFMADVWSGAIARKRRQGMEWRRPMVEDIAARAFPPNAMAGVDLMPADADVEATSRALRIANDIGLIETEQWRDRDEETWDYYSLPAIRKINWELLCKLCGTLMDLARDRKHKEPASKGPEGTSTAEKAQGTTAQPTLPPGLVRLKKKRKRGRGGGLLALEDHLTADLF